MAVYLLCAFIILNQYSISAAVQKSPVFQEVEIRMPFRKILMGNPEFMQRGGASCFSDARGVLALIGIGKVVPENNQPRNMLKARRAGEILARTAILELRDGIKISTARGLRKGPSLSSFFQVTETQVEGKIRQLPVIGTWWSQDRNFFYVAVGNMVDTPDSEFNLARPVDLSGKRLEGGENDKDLADMEGEEPFISLLKLSPVLCRNGGVQGFIMSNNDRVLIAVGSASLQGSPAKTRKVARLRAVRSLLGHKEEIQLSSVEYLGDREHLRLSKRGEELILISQFLSIQKERIAGVVNALPVVATWKDPEEQILYVAIGNSFR